MPLCVFLAVEDGLEEVCLRRRQRLRPQCHGLYEFLKRFSFLKGVLHGAVEQRLSRGSIVALLLVEAPRLLLIVRVLG